MKLWPLVVAGLISAIIAYLVNQLPPIKETHAKLPKVVITVIGFIVLATVAAVVLTHVTDPDNKTPSPTGSASSKGKMLSNGWIRVFWTGDGETLEVRWDPMEYDNLDSYDVELLGISPEEVSTSIGYRPGEELDRVRVIHPVADTKRYYQDTQEITHVAPGESWYVCVTGLAPSPKSKPNEIVVIKGSKRCSDTFVVPS